MVNAGPCGAFLRNSLWKRSLRCEKSSYSVLLSCWYSRTRIRHGQRSWNRGQWYLYIFVFQNITPVSHLCHRERRILVNLGTCYCWKKNSSIEQSEKTTPNDWMIIYFNGVYVPTRCVHVVPRTGVSGRSGQSGGTSVVFSAALEFVTNTRQIGRRSAANRSSRSAMTESAFVKDTDFIRASLFTSSLIVKNLNQHIVKSPDKQRLKKLCARRSNIWANLDK